ncbi:hypothetical protein [uncultured Aquimarina sp.]|uniref:hypothetical protein n=1 Tax=uncultured Aquimarina sp. TaxID=575652 RepID=UPI002630F778|nr:hypothetical protein [uncultured Aquimarina sp.]
MNKLLPLLFLIVLPSTLMCQTEPFKKLKVNFNHVHNGVQKIEYQIIHKKNKLYLIESDKKQEIEYFKLGYILSFINKVKSQIDSCQGFDYAGIDKLELDIDNQKIGLEDCSTEEIDVAKLLNKLKKKKVKLRADANHFLQEEVSNLVNITFNEKLKGCWNINTNFQMQLNQILVLSKGKTADKYQWCFKDGNLKTTSENNLLYKSKLTKEDSIGYYPNGIWFTDFIMNNNTLDKVELTHSEYMGLFDEDLDDNYNYGFLKLVFSIIELKEDLVILELIDKKKNVDNEYGSLLEENKN